MLVARVGHLLRPVALREHHHRPAGGLELLDVRVHPAGGGRPERAGCVALRRLGRTGVVDAVILQVLRHLLARIEPLLDLGVGDVAGDDHRSRQHHPRPHRVLRQLGADLVHRAVEVDVDHVGVVEIGLGRLGQEPGRVVLQLLDEDALAGDLAQRLAIGRTRHGQTHRAARTVAGEADHPHVVAEVLAAELRTDAGRLRQLEELGLELDVTEPVSELRPLRRERVEVLGRGELGRLDRELRRRPTDDDGEVVRRARRRS